MAEKKAGFALNIFGRILIMMIVVALIPLGGLIYITGFEQQKDWRQNVNQNLALTASGLAARVNGWLDTNHRALRENGALPDITSMYTERQAPVLKAMQGTYEWSYLVFTVATDGRNVGRSDDSPLTHYGDRGYYKQVIGGKPLAHEVLIGRTSGKPALILAGPIGPAGAQLQGVIAMAMHLTDLSEAVVGTKIGSTGYAILVDDTKKTIAHGRPEKVSQALQDLSAHPALKAEPGNPVIFEEDGRRIVALTTQTKLGWTLIVQQDYDEAFAPLLEARRNAFILTAVAGVLALAIAYLLAQQISAPIRALTTAADAISRGEFEKQIPGTDRKDEIGALARAFERTAISIKMAFERLRKKS
jgi:methyl-accepting chemotaxis protein